MIKFIKSLFGLDTPDTPEIAKAPEPVATPVVEEKKPVAKKAAPAKKAPAKKPAAKKAPAKKPATSAAPKKRGRPAKKTS
jgi:hypothetical protein